MPADPPLRASDAEREAVARRLADHMAAGRLDLTEYDERVAAAYAATTLAELKPLLHDLPVQPTAGRPGHSAPVRSAWTSWAVTTVICLTIWTVSSLVQDVQPFWPFWVFGPWGLVLLIRTASPLRASRCA